MLLPALDTCHLVLNRRPHIPCVAGCGGWLSGSLWRRWRHFNWQRQPQQRVVTIALQGEFVIFYHVAGAAAEQVIHRTLAAVCVARVWRWLPECRAIKDVHLRQLAQF